MSCPPCRGFLTSTIGKKYLVALTAVFWCLFVMVHMLGNMLIFVSAEAYNKYSHALTSNPFIYVAEFVLLVLILVHIFLALGLKLRNYRTKPALYTVRPMREKSAAISSRTMAYTGTFILAFIIWHLITFKYGQQYFVFYQGVEVRDLYRLVVEKFHNPIYVSLYCVVMVLIGSHLYHGVKSIFQSLGINHPRYNSFFRCFGYSYAIIVAAGFFSQPIYVYFMR
ncbi:MAG: succinate dehydrogenase cytochrome b subunit [Bdellovibrionota bacterium]